MLQNISKHIQGWVAGIITAIIALTFVFWGIQYEHSGSQKNDVIAKINGKEITSWDVDAAYQQWKNGEEKRLKQPLTVDQQQQLRAMALQQLVNVNVLYDAAEQQGFQVSIDQIKQIIMAAPEFQVNGQFSPQRFQQILLNNGLTPEKFFQQMQQSFTIRQVVDGILLSSFALRDEMSEVYSLIKQTRDFNYFLLPANHFVVKDSPPGQKILEYYRQHKQDFRTPERVKVSYLLLSPETLSQGLKIDPAQSKQYYQDHPGEFANPQQWQIDSVVVKIPATTQDAGLHSIKNKLITVRSQLKNTPAASLEQLAKQIPGSQVLLNQWVNADQMSDSMRKTLTQLKVGEVSLPVYTRDGLAIVQVKATKPGGIKDFATALPEIEAVLKHQRVQEILNKKSEKLSEYTYTNPSTLSVAAKNLNLPIQTSPWMTREGAEGIFSDKKLLATIFSADIIQQGDNSEPIELADGSLIVVRVDEHHPSGFQPLAAVKPQIISKLQQQEAQNQAGLEAFKIQNALTSGISPDAIAKQYNLIWHKEQNINRTDKSISKQILTEAFNLAPSAAHPYPVTTALLPTGDYAIIQLQAIKLANYNDASPDDVDKLHSTLSNYWGQTNYQLYMQGAIDNTKVTYTKPSSQQPSNS